MFKFKVQGSNQEYDVAPAGSKWGNYGSSRTGLASALDSNIYKRNIEKEISNYGGSLNNGTLEGDIGCYSFMLTDKNGNKVDNKPLKFGGRTFFPDGKGVFTVVDSDYLNNELEKNAQVEEYLNTVMERVLVSDRTAEMMLTGAQWTKIVNAKCNPSLIKNLHPHGIEFAERVSRLKEIVNERLPIVEGMTPSSAENAN